MLAVANMQGAAHDIWEVNTDFDYHEEQRLSDPGPVRTPWRAGCPVVAPAAAPDAG